MLSTSAEAIRILRESGRLSKTRLAVAEVVAAATEPMTANEIHAELARAGRVMNKPSVTPRLAELVRQGAVREAGIRRCRESGFRCATYELTGRAPTELPPCRMRVEGPKDRQIRLLTAEVEALRTKLARWGRPTNRARVERDDRSERLFK